MTMTHTTHDMLAGLNAPQAEAVCHHKGPLLILAGAGSGKTRVLTHRIAYLIDHYGVSPYHILALTFTNKAAGEMRERVDQIVGDDAGAIWVSTFHSTCVRILRREIEALGYSRSFTIYDSDDQRALMRDVLKYLDLDPKKYKERNMLSSISKAKDELKTPEDIIKDSYGTRDAFHGELLSRIYREYQRRLQDSNALDFDDLIVKTIQLFRENPDILSRYQQRFRYILVDEYQDTNTAQFELIRLLASSTGEDGNIEHNLCVVGDDDQSIYKFRGANIHNILNFEQQYPDARVIRLEENYRSTQNILDAANSVIHNNTERKDKSLWTQKAKGDPIYFTQFENEYEEAGVIASAISHAAADGEADYGDFAILYRTNAQSRVFEEKLIQENVPYRIVGAVNFYQRKEIKDILAYLRTIDNGLDDISVKRIINVPKRGIGLTSIDRLTSYAQAQETSFYGALLHHEYIDGLGRAKTKLTSFVNLIESLKELIQEPGYSVEEVIRTVVEQTGYETMIENEEEEEKAQARLENIQELINKAASYEENCEDEPTLSGFLEEVALVADIDNVEDGTNLVLLMTLHSAKGLEFPYVYLVGMEDGIFPGAMACYAEDPQTAQEEMEEERRLCYVGITRAMKKLSLSCARSRFRNGEQQFNPPSRFIQEIPRYLLSTTGNIGNRRPSPSAGVSSPRGMSGADFLRHQPGGQGLSGSRYASRPASTPSYGTGSWNPMAEKQAHRQARPASPGTGNLFAGNSMISKGFGSSYAARESKPAHTSIDYRMGDRVRHTRFGEGEVTALEEKGGDYQVTVTFDNGSTRRMMASFAKLKKVDI